MDNQKIITLMHHLVRNDPYTKDITDAIDIKINEINDVAQDLYNQFWFDTMTWGADVLANFLGIKFKTNTQIEEKRSIVEARWKNSSKADLYLLQAIAESWQNGETEVTFVNAKIIIKFISEYGIPANLDNFKAEIEKAKPAHLPYEFIFAFMTWDQFDTYNKTWDMWDTLNLMWDEFEAYKE